MASSPRAKRAPVTFVVARHLLSHPEAAPADIARHCSIPIQSASRAYKHLLRTTALETTALWESMRQAGEKPHWKSFYFHAPNPAQWEQAFPAKAWLSGEHAAETVDQLNLVSDHRLFYIRQEDLEAAFDAARNIVARTTHPSKANLVIRIADPWMSLPDKPFAEKGQRWFDYAKSKNLQLSRWRP